MPASWKVGTMLALALITLASMARAQRVVLVRPADTDPVLFEAFNRLNAELRLHDFEVTILDTTVDARSPDALEEAARRADALASISFARHGGKTGVDVWLSDRVSGKTSIRTLEPGNVKDAPSVIAIRAVDLLRTSLREFAGEPPPPEVVGADTRPAPEAVRELTAPPRPPWEVRADVVMLWNRPTLGVAFGPGIGLGHKFRDRFELGIGAAGPLVGPSWRTAEGAAAVRQALAWAEVKWSAYTSELVDVSASLGAGVHHLQAQGEADPPLGSRSDHVLSFAGTLGAHGELHLGSSAAIGLTVRAVGLTPRPGVSLGNSVALVQFPLLGASAGLCVGF
jgi:hypothetical protein